MILTESIKIFIFTFNFLFFNENFLEDAKNRLIFWGNMVYSYHSCGDIAHLVERYVRNVQVTCSSHAISTNVVKV